MTALDDFTVGKILSYKGSKNPKKAMMSSKKAKSLLKKFRTSKKYRLLKGSSGIFNPMNCSKNTKSNIFDKAESLITNYIATGKLESSMQMSEEQKKFSDVILGYLINSGLDYNLIEVESAGDNNSILVYLDEAFVSKSISLKEILKEIAEVEKVQVPSDDLSIGAYVFKITPLNKANQGLTKEFFVPDKESKAEATVQLLKGKKLNKGKKLFDKLKESNLFEHDYTLGSTVWFIESGCVCSGEVVNIHNFGKDSEVYEIYDPISYVTVRRAPSEVYPSRIAAYSKMSNFIKNYYPFSESNPKPVKGEILIDSTSKQSFKVVDVIGRSTKIQGLKSTTDQEQIVPTIDLERSIVSGRFKRLSESHNKSEKYSRCVNCFSDLIKVENTNLYKCFSCGFHAKFI
jgi:hypothetical protein